MSIKLREPNAIFNEFNLEAIEKNLGLSKTDETLAKELIINPFQETMILSSVPGAIRDFLCFFIIKRDFSRELSNSFLLKEWI